MSEITTLLGPNFVTEVMESVQVSAESTQLSTTALQSLRSGAVVATAQEAWGKLTGLLNDIAGRGLDYVQAPLATFQQYLERVMDELGEEAEGFRQLMRDKVRDAMDKAMDTALKSVKSRVLVGGDVYTLTSFTLQTKVAYTTSLEVSLTALCRFIAAGEVVATGTYNLANASVALPV